MSATAAVTPPVQSERDDEAGLGLGAWPLLAILAGCGLVLVALGNNAAREGDGSLQLLFWGGLVLAYGPIAFRLFGRGAGRGERLGLAVTLGLTLFLVKVLRSPVEITRFDEFGWWRATDEVIRSGNSFHENPLNVATGGFPGLATLTAAIAQLTGLSIFHSALAALGTARLVLVLALFLFLERLTGSSRAAGIGIAIYACNPSFLYFDVQFGYESLALMSAGALLLASQRWAGMRRFDLAPPAAGLAVVVLLLSLGLTVTHHMTTLATLAFLALWTTLSLVFLREGWIDGSRKGPLLPAAAMAIFAAVWFALVAAGVTIEELGGVFSSSFHSLVDLVTGSSSSKKLFSGAGEKEPLAARALALVSIMPLLILVPVGIWGMWRRRVSAPLKWTLAAVAVLYPVTLGLRLTAASSETSQRASEFVFIGVAFLAAWLSPRLPALGWSPAKRIGAQAAATALAVLSFVGGFLIGELQATRQPGPFLVGAEDRSISPQGVAAAEFAAGQLPAESRLLADRNNATLLGSYGEADPIFGRYDGISLPRILFSPRFDRADERAIHGQSIAYVVVDRRLSRELPLIGYYVESDERGAFNRRQPVGPGVLEKFKRVGALSRIYSNGAIVIYDATALLR